jgi:16S rRNA (uracil1498-N3)-methyltransferase
MSRRLFYVDSIRDGAARIEGDTAKHLRKVLRAEIGQKYEVSDGHCIHLAEISGFGKQLIEFRVLEELAPPPLPARVRLFAALIKFDHFEWMVEKATELGVDRVTPVVAFRTDHGLDRAAAKRLDRWKRVAAEAGQQSRRLAPPLIDPVVEFDQAVSHAASCRLLLDEQRSAPPVLDHLPPGLSEAALLVGPEGGWDERERLAARQAGWLAVSLGPQVLRAETAGIVALGIVMAAAGRSTGA